MPYSWWVKPIWESSEQANSNMVDLALGLEAFLAAFRLLRLSRLVGLPTAGQPKTGSDFWHRSEHRLATWGRIATPETETEGLSWSAGFGRPWYLTSNESFLKERPILSGEVRWYGIGIRADPHRGRWCHVLHHPCLLLLSHLWEVELSFLFRLLCLFQPTLRSGLCTHQCARANGQCSLCNQGSLST